MTQPTKAEVGYTPEDNNNERLPGSIEPAPVRGDSAYGTNDYAKDTPLYAADTITVGQPTIGGDYSFTNLAKGAGDVTGTSNEVETTYNHENLSAKFKYPNVSQDVPKYGSPKTAFNDHN